MTTHWQTFLHTQNARIADGQVQHFGDSHAELQATANAKTVLADLSHLGLLQISGDDRISFLQGQLTNDIKLLTGNNSHYAGYCTPKGRLLALFLVFAHHEHLYLQLNHPLLEAVAKRLKMYVLRSKVSIIDTSDSLIRMGFAGQQAETILQTRFEQVPSQPHELHSSNDALLIRLPGNTPRYEILATPEHAEQIWLALSAQAGMVGAPCWEWLEIQAGIPEINIATQEAFVPQMVNLDALGGINFKKGCYTGQEIIARTHYLGKVKRRTLPLHIHAGETAGVGSQVYAASSDEPVGMLVRVAPAPDGGLDALAELRLGAIEGSEIYLDKTSGQALKLSELPYSLNQ